MLLKSWQIEKTNLTANSSKKIKRYEQTMTLEEICFTFKAEKSVLNKEWKMA